jgi:hypothetical protein
MKITEIITEAFDKPYAFNWSRGDHGDYDVFVKLPDGSPLNIAFNREGDDGWHVAFDRGHSQEITGEGDAQRIFATVLTSIQQFILKEDPDRLYFSASKDVEPGQNPTSRARLYERMVERYAKSMGYDVVVDDRRGHTMFVLDKDQSLREESFNGIDIDMDIEGDEIMVKAMANGRELGHVLFVDEGEYLMPQDLEVDERFQGQGIAAAMYDYVKSKGYKIRRSGQQTDAGAGFWGKHRPEQNVWENFADGMKSEMNFEQGDCPIFAIALHRLSKLPLMALVEYDDEMGSAVLIHAYVKLNDKWRIDATGETDVDWMLQKYPNNGAAEEIEISERDLIKLGYGKNKCPTLQQVVPHAKEVLQDIKLNENFADGKVKGKSRPGRVKRAGASCNGSVTDLRARAKNASGEKAKMYHWCANMKSGRKK